MQYIDFTGMALLFKSRLCSFCRGGIEYDRMNNMSLVLLKSEAPAYGGFSIAKLDGKIVMLKGAVPGETVEAAIDEEKKDYCRASVVKVIAPSPDRVEPSCPYFGTCGGCQLQYITYQRQGAIKEEILRESLKRLAKIDLRLSSPLVHDTPWHYRFRGQFKAARGEIGFYKEKTMDVIDIEACPLMREEVNEYFRRAKVLLRNDDIKELHISFGNGAVALLKVPASRNDWNAIAARLRDAGFSGVAVEMDKRKLLHSGSDHIMLDLDGLHYFVSPMSFFQSHWELNRVVVRFVKDTLQPLAGKRILDLYSGAGNFSLPLAREAGEIVAVEENPSAIKDGRRNLEMNDIRNCRFVKSTAEHLQVKDPVDILITDPPRLGLSNRAIEKVLATQPEKIVYISCNPTTLARDLKKLIMKYEIESVHMIDFFPQTYHIESLTFLRIR